MAPGRSTRRPASPGFALIALLAATPISATFGVGSLALAADADLSDGIDMADLVAGRSRWSARDHAGHRAVGQEQPLGPHLAGSFWKPEPSSPPAAAVGLLAFSPLIEQTPNRDPLGFLAVLPLMWAALRRGQRDTATVALVLSGFALWGAMTGEGPFARSTLNDSLLLLIMYMISTSVPTLALSADVAVHKQTERNLREVHVQLDKIVQQRTTALEETREALHQAQKMEALGQLTGGIAHDFNNVLTVIINSVEVGARLLRIRMRKPENDWIGHCRPPVMGHRWCSRCSSSLADIRCRCRPRTSTRSVSSAVAMFSRSCPESIEICTDLAPDLRWATADATQVQTAILNLVVNARDAMPSGGRLTIATRNVPDGARYRQVFRQATTSPLP